MDRPPVVRSVEPLRHFLLPRDMREGPEGLLWLCAFLFFYACYRATGENVVLGFLLAVGIYQCLKLCWNAADRIIERRWREPQRQASLARHRAQMERLRMERKYPPRRDVRRNEQADRLFREVGLDPDEQWDERGFAKE